jgi:hypothetical protein
LNCSTTSLMWIKDCKTISVPTDAQTPSSFRE